MGIVTPLHDLPYLSQDMVVMDMVETYHGCIFYLYSHGICGVITSDVNANIAIYSENANLACKKYEYTAINMHKNGISTDSATVVMHIRINFLYLVG